MDIELNKEDRRVKKTKQALEGALATLMLKKEIHKITIKELTDQADMHRATFYAHYQDIYDLYEKIEEESYTGIKQIVVSKSNHEYSAIYTTIIEYIYNNKHLYSMLLGKRADPRFVEKIIEILQQQYLEIWRYETGQDHITESFKYLTHYHMHGCLAMIRKWITDNYNMPMETLAKLLKQADDNFDRLE